jgi:DNA-binding SARP family transcriptional activator
LSGDLPKAAEFLGRAREDVIGHGLNFLHPPVMFYDLVLKTHLGKHREAEEIASNLVSVTLATGNLFLHGDALLYRGKNFYHWGNFSRAREVLLKAREVLSRDEALAIGHLAIIKILLGLIAYHLSLNGEAERELQEGLEHFRKDENFLFMKEGFVALALFTWRQGRMEEARKYLQDGMALADRHDLFFNWLLNRQDLLRASILALELGLEEVWGYATRVLGSYLPDLAGPELERLSGHPNPKIAAKAWEIRQALHRAGVPRLQIMTLGGFQIRRGGALLGNPERQQSQLLLKAILAHGPSGTPTEVLMEDLWPESTPEAAEKNFKVSLHRLRKFLEPRMDRNFGSSFIHLRGNLVFLDHELCEVDVDAFLRWANQGRQGEKQEEPQKALASYHQALDLYGGDFLAEELYYPWVDRKRQELREIYLDVLLHAAGLHENRGALTKAINCYKKVIRTDPLLEMSYQKLMLLYFQRGMRSEALRVYEDCRKALREGLDEEPGEATTAILQKIKDS